MIEESDKEILLQNTESVKICLPGRTRSSCRCSTRWAGAAFSLGFKYAALNAIKYKCNVFLEFACVRRHSCQWLRLRSSFFGVSAQHRSQQLAHGCVGHFLPTLLRCIHNFWSQVLLQSFRIFIRQIRAISENEQKERGTKKFVS